MVPRPGALVTVSHEGGIRRGQVLEIVPESTDVTLRVRWEDGQETRINPACELGLRVSRNRFFRPRPGRYDSRTFLLRSLPRKSVGAEVGVWKGDFAAEMLHIVRPSRLYLVDPWEVMVDSSHQHPTHSGRSCE